MAKFRFPGKALKLNYRKRVRFRYDDEIDEEDQRVLQIKEGFLLFRQLFGESDEDDDFEGFTLQETPEFIQTQEKNDSTNQEAADTKAKNSKGCSQIRERVKKKQITTEKQNDSFIPLDNGNESSLCLEETVINEADLEVLVDGTVKIIEPSQERKTCDNLAKNIKKLSSKDNVCVISERTSKKFVLPTVSARSSRIIKPNKRLFVDFTPICSSNQGGSEDSCCKNTSNDFELSPKAPLKLKNNDQDPDRLSPDPNEKESDPVCRSITFYTNSITEQYKGHVGRPPKKLSHRGEGFTKEEISTPSGSSSPLRVPKEEKVKEKIEKLLRSPWDNRLKQNSSKVCGKEKERSLLFSGNNSAFSKTILRKARLNLNKQTLQKIRSPSSVQRLVPLSEEDTAEKKCGLCQICSQNTICRYGVSCCEACQFSINNFTEGITTNLECCGSQGECQLVGLSIDERCEACWLCRILLTCAMPSLLHDRLRKQLPTILREKVPTSLGRSFNINAIVLPEGDYSEIDGNKTFLGVDSCSGGFGSVVDLPGGWKRKTGNDVVVISPSGEKFRSVSKLDEYLKRQGINAEASVLFGNLNSKTIQNTVSKTTQKIVPKPFPKLSTKSNKINNVVVTTLPGGWTRRIKWRSTGDKFDTYVCSPDGRTFRSCRELSAYFQRIGKVDDIHKYFPVRNATTSHTNSSDNSEASSTEPVSSPETSSEGSLDQKSPCVSDSEGEECTSRLKAPVPNLITALSRITRQKRIRNSAGEWEEKIEVTQENNINNIKSRIENPPKKLVGEVENRNTRSRNEIEKNKNFQIQSEGGVNLEIECQMPQIGNRKTKPKNEFLNKKLQFKKIQLRNENEKRRAAKEKYLMKLKESDNLSDNSMDTDNENEPGKMDFVNVNLKEDLIQQTKNNWIPHSKTNLRLSPVIISNLNKEFIPMKNKSLFNDIKVDNSVLQPDKKKTVSETNFSKVSNRSVIDLNSLGKVGRKETAENNLNGTVSEDSNMQSIGNVIEESLDGSEMSMNEVQNSDMKNPQENSFNDDVESSFKKHKKKKKKKKRRHEKYLKEKSLASSSNSNLICDVDKIVTRVNVDKEDVNEPFKEKSPVAQKLASSLFNEDGELNKPLKGTPSRANLSSSFFTDTSYLSSDLPCHPNDTWQTLISNSFLETKDDNDCNEPILDVTNEPELVTIDTPSKNELSPKAIEESSIAEDPGKVAISTMPRNTRKKNGKKLSSFTTQPFGNGWSRKIKWSDKGLGKVSFLTSPDGQKIVSSIELLAYFKKAGKPMLNISYYFPKDLVREIPQTEEETVTNNENTRESPEARLSPSVEESKMAKLGKEMNNRSRQQPTKLGRRTLNFLKVAGRKRGVKSSISSRAILKNVNSEAMKLNLDDSNQLLSDGGPRVKHVCRSQAQVLGMPRAVFPSPGKEKQLKRVLYSTGKKTKFLSVATPKGRKVLKKTLWCNKCAGCTTPNCRKCVNCVDMKKYGGPGTKKKPCIMRKCFNPFKAIKASSAEETFTEEKDHVGVKKIVANVPKSCEPIVLPPIQLNNAGDDSESDVKDDLTVDTADDLREEVVSNEEFLPNIEKSIFIPKLMKQSHEVKDRGDVQAGKECNPGARVNIDYWQEYDAEEMLVSGFPIITSVPLQYDSLCFRCGSAGMEQLLYCIWCCEGVHPFCLEEGEGPDSDEQEALWVCKKCAVCHVCGGPGYDNLLQCNGCKRHYHLECLGPSSHVACQAPSDGSWIVDAQRLLSYSWPQQTPIIEVENAINREEKDLRDIVVYENLECLRDGEDNMEKSLFACAVKPVNAKWQLPEEKEIEITERKKLPLVQSVRIEDAFENLEEEGGHICLEEEFGALEEVIPKEEDFVQLIRNVNLWSEPPPEKDYVGLEDDEYLCLKYKKILPFLQDSTDLSLHHILQIIHRELFLSLGYPLWSELFAKGLVKEKSWKASCITADIDTESADSASMVTSVIDLKCMLEIRRREAQIDIKNKEEMRIQEEKRHREMERERLKKKRLMEYQNEICDKNDNSKINRKNLKSFSWHKKNNERRNSVGSLSSRDNNNVGTPILCSKVNESFVEYESDQIGSKANSSLWQPKSWEEFDAMLLRATEKESSIISHRLIKGSKQNRISELKRNRGSKELRISKVNESKNTDNTSGSLDSSQRNFKWLVSKKLKRIIDQKNKMKMKGSLKYSSPSKKKAKKLKMSKCSVKITRLELLKNKRSPKSSPKKVTQADVAPKSSVGSPCQSPKLSIAFAGSPEPPKTRVCVNKPSATADYSVQPSIECLPVEDDFENSSITKFESMNGNIGNGEAIQINEYNSHESVENSLPDKFPIEVNSNDVNADSAQSSIELVSCNQTSPKISIDVFKNSKLPFVPGEKKETKAEINNLERKNNSNLKVNKKENKLEDELNVSNMAKRNRRSSYGRASELASMRKAMMDL